MLAKDIPETVTIGEPAAELFRGDYVTKNDFRDETYSWYLKGDIAKEKPHFTVGSRDEDRDTGRWFRFHITIPVGEGKSSFNAHLFYIIKNGIVTRQQQGFTNKKDLPTKEKGMLDDLLEKNGVLYDKLAQCFYNAAKGA